MSNNGNMTQAGSKLGKPPTLTLTPTPTAAQKMESQDSRDEKLSLVQQPKR